MSERIGTTIAGRYLVDALIGRGGMADVYGGRDTVLGREVAIKLLTDRSEMVRKRFLREAQSMAHLNHQNIVSVYDAGDDHEQLFIVMELVRGKTLKEAAASGIGFERSIEIFISLLEALDYAHSQSVIHRDIKPANVMILDDGTVKVMDFGLSRRVSDASSVTIAGEIVGTIAYLSPERFLGKPTDSRSDLYSVGCVMYEIFTGEVPFKSSNDDLVAVIFAHVNEPPVPPRTKNPKIPAELERIIMRLLEKDPVNRYKSAREAIADLSGVLSKDASSTSTATTPPPVERDGQTAKPGRAQTTGEIRSILGLADPSDTTKQGEASVRELLDRTFKPAQVLREAQKDVLSAMLATRKRDYPEAVRAYDSALNGYRQINNELEFARTALKYAAMVVEKNAQGTRSSDGEMNGVISALATALPILRGRRLFGELEESERTLYALQRIRVNTSR